MKIIRTATVPMSLSTFLEGAIEPLMEKYELVLVSSPDKELEELHAQYGVKVVPVQMERHISPKKDLKALCLLIRVFRKEKPYMVHSMTPKAGLLCMMAAWWCRVPRRVHTFTGLVWPTATGLKRRILMVTDWLTCVCATHIIPEGEGVKNDLQRFITKKPMRVLGYGNVRGVDMNYWCRSEEVVKKSETLRKADCFTFLFVGRMVGDKGINELVEAFLRLLKNHKARLLLVGRLEDELDPLSTLTMDRIACTPEIEFVGPKFGKDLLACYAASDCFAFPSYREGFPNTVLEAGAMGLPCIVTDINGSREIICDELTCISSDIPGGKACKNGMVIPSKDVDTLYAAMQYMVENTAVRTQMAENARPMIASRFEQGFVRQCLFDYYDIIMNSK